MKREKSSPVPEVVAVCILFLMLLLGSTLRQPELEENVETVICAAENGHRMLSSNENMKGE